jgi:hypothetical protein
MSTRLLDRFLQQLGLRGLSVRHDGEDKFSLIGPTDEMTPEVLRACKAFKALLLEKYCPKKEADRPDNAVAAEAPPIDTQTYASEVLGEFSAPVSMPMPGRVELSMDPQWMACPQCKSEVSKPQMKAMTPGMWMNSCGIQECPSKPHG